MTYQLPCPCSNRLPACPGPPGIVTLRLQLHEQSSKQLYGRSVGTAVSVDLSPESADPHF
jgi:hypothetical protein